MWNTRTASTDLCDLFAHGTLRAGPVDGGLGIRLSDVMSITGKKGTQEATRPNGEALLLG